MWIGPGPGPGHQETSVSQKPPALAASPATCSLRRLKPAQQPSYLKPQPPQACPGARTSASYKPLQPTATQPACSPQPSPVSVTASSACPSSQDLCQPSHSSEGAIPKELPLTSQPACRAPGGLSAVLPCSACNISSSCRS